MEVFGLAIQDVIFSLFLPFLFFFLLIYSLLKKTQILGEKANTLNTLISLVISALAIFSLYSLGLSFWLPYLAAVTAVSAFILMYFFGITGHAMKKTSEYISGEAFKTEDEKKFEAMVKNCENIWARFEKAQDPDTRGKIFVEMDSEVKKLEPLAEKLGKSLYDFDWYRKYKEIAEAIKR